MYEKYKSWCADAIEKTGAAVEGGKADIKMMTKLATLEMRIIATTMRRACWFVQALTHV